ncbi:hypothetical protein RQP46_011182 [Phenoliferia psychrophenolica]
MGLAQGWIVTLSDHEGPASAWTSGRQEGMAVLDSIRATLQFGEAFGLFPKPAEVKTVMWGYSGGAIATGWAEALLNSYAPDLASTIVGGASGGTPADLKASLLNLNGGPHSGYVLASLVGLATGYPAFSKLLYSLLTPKMLAMVNDALQTQCTGDGNAENIDFFADDTYFTTGTSTMSLPIWKATLLEQQFGLQNQTLAPTIPLYV